MLFFLLPIIIPLVTAFPTTGEGTCYKIDGSIDRLSSACYYLNSVGASMCCQGNEECLDEGLCAGAPNGPVGPDDDNKAIWRRSCSDYTWQDPACLAIAPYVVASGVQLTNCSDGTYCPRIKFMLNTTCCDNRLGATVALSGAPISPSQVSHIRNSESSISEITLTSSDSARSTAVTSVFPDTSGMRSSLSIATTSPPGTTGTADAGGFSRDQNIALGVGIGIGLPTLLVASLTLILKSRNQNKSQPPDPMTPILR